MAYALAERAARQQISQLADTKELQDLLNEEGRLWPAEPRTC